MCVAACRLLRCGRCGEERYCGKACQVHAWKAWHRRECGSLGRLGAAAERVDAAAAERVDAATATQAILLGRAARLAAADAGAAARVAAIRPSGSNSEARVHARSRALALARQVRLLPEDGELADDEALLRLLATFDSNNFGVLDSDEGLATQKTVAAALCPEGAMLNHSCEPTCFLSYASPPEGADRCGRDQVFRCLHAVATGAELTHCYVDAEAPFAERQAALMEDYGFTCECTRCQREAAQEGAAGDREAVRAALAAFETAALEDDPAEELRSLRGALAMLAGRESAAASAMALRIGDAEAVTALAVGEMRDAAAAYERQATLRERFHAPGHPRIATDRAAAVAALFAEGDLAAARQLVASAADDLALGLGERHPYAAAMRHAAAEFGA